MPIWLLRDTIPGILNLKPNNKNQAKLFFPAGDLKKLLQIQGKKFSALALGTAAEE